jgi:hypothetical protein
MVVQSCVLSEASREQAIVIPKAKSASRLGLTDAAVPEALVEKFDEPRSRTGRQTGRGRRTQRVACGWLERLLLAAIQRKQSTLARRTESNDLVVKT